MKLTELAALLEPPSKNFDGNLILDDHKTTWTLNFVQGQLLYIVDELHAIRRWGRLLKQHFPNWNWQIDVDQANEHQPWQLGLLDKSIDRKQLSLIRAKLVIRTIAKECLFELSYCPTFQSHWKPRSFPISLTCRNLSLSGWEIRMTLNKIETMRQQWEQAGLENLSPNLSPTLRKTVKAQFLPIENQYLQGDCTLWDIAGQLDKSPVEIAQSLLPFVENGMLEFNTIPDLTLQATSSKADLSSRVRQPSYAQPTLSKPQVAPSTGLPSTPLAKPQPTPLARLQSTSFATSQSTRLAELPSTGTLSTPTAKPQSALLTGKQPVIACIDDSPVLAHSLKKILVAAGYRALIIQEPMRGFSELIKHKPSLILLDLLLPNADGYSICKFLRDTPVFKDTPIIILTGQNSSIDRARARLAGASEFLTKPPQPEQLIQMIQKHLGKK
ncbi:MAG: response regulator [Cyanobacteria bacterium P01_F01_bin.86]